MRKLTLAQVQSDARRRGGRCLSETYVDSLTLLEWQCAQGHRWRAVAHSIRQGHWCKRCADDKLRHSPGAPHAIAAERGGRCLAERYTNSQEKLEWECQRGHRWLASFNSIKQGSWCPECKAALRARLGFQRSERSFQANGSAAAESAAMTQNAPAPSRP
jgi:hypothetical protein